MGKNNSTGPKRTPEQIEADRPVIANMYLRSFTLKKIREELPKVRNTDYILSTTVIYYEIKKIREAWRKATIESYNEYLHRELDKIDALESEYWLAWEKSKNTKRRVQEKQNVIQIPDEDSPPEVDDDGRVLQVFGEINTPVERTVTEEESCGDAVYLHGIHWCIHQRIKLLGLDATPQERPMSAKEREEYEEKVANRKFEILMAIVEREQKSIDRSNIE